MRLTLDQAESLGTRRLARLAAEFAAMAAFAVGLDTRHLLEAAAAADRGDWSGAKLSAGRARVDACVCAPGNTWIPAYDATRSLEAAIPWAEKGRVGEVAGLLKGIARSAALSAALAAYIAGSGGPGSRADARRAREQAELAIGARMAAAIKGAGCD